MPDFQLPPPSGSKDFADLVMDMCNELHHTHSFKLFGKNGHSQKGLDIISSEKGMVIQCKAKDLSRKSILVKKELLSDIEETIDLVLTKKPKIKFDTLYIATTFHEHPDFDEFCTTIKEEKKMDFNIIFWGWETIRRKLLDLPKTLSHHYGNFKIPVTAETAVISRLKMKKKIEQDFAEWLDYSFENRKRNSEMMLHSIDDTAYPEHVKNSEGKYQWFKVDIRSRSHKGIAFTTGIEYIFINCDWQWTDQPPTDLEKFRRIKAEKVSIVAYEDIVSYDLRGNEHFLYPHFYCKFRHKGTPFTEEYFISLEKDLLHVHFDQSTRMGNKKGLN